MLYSLRNVNYTPFLLSTFLDPNSYWATPLLLACEYPWTPQNAQRPKLDPLLCAGVRTFIDLTRGRISAVHCRGGIGRTGMIIVRLFLGSFVFESLTSFVRPPPSPHTERAQTCLQIFP
jgi:protein tyrosine phosphatase